MMQIAHRKKLIYGGLLLAGASYFALFSQINVPFLPVKLYLTMVPLQAIALVYVAFVIRRGRLPQNTE